MILSGLPQLREWAGEIKFFKVRTSQGILF